MSQEQYLKILQAEIRKINEEIDRKIIQGQIYAIEAKKHKMLLERMRKHAKNNFLSRIFAELTRVFNHA